MKMQHGDIEVVKHGEKRDEISQAALGRIADLEAEIKLLEAELDPLKDDVKACAKTGMFPEQGRAQMFFESKMVAIPFPYKADLEEEISKKELAKRQKNWKEANKTERCTLKVTLMVKEMDTEPEPVEEDDLDF